MCVCVKCRFFMRHQVSIYELKVYFYRPHITKFQHPAWAHSLRLQTCRPDISARRKLYHRRSMNKAKQTKIKLLALSAFLGEYTKTAKHKMRRRRVKKIPHLLSTPLLPTYVDNENPYRAKIHTRTLYDKPNLAEANLPWKGRDSKISCAIHLLRHHLP